MNPQLLRSLLAAVAGAAYLLLCALTWLRHRRHASALRLPQQAGDGAVAPLLVAYASQTGMAEELARQTANALQTAGVAVQLRSFEPLDAAVLKATAQALLIVSTYGEGDPPDGAARFVALMRGEDIDLSRLHYGLLALGDRSYARFCRFGRELDAWLQARGAQALFPRIDVDKGDADALQEWRHRLSHIAGTADLPDWQGTPFEPWTLHRRVHLNPGSQGGPVYHLELVPHARTGARWQAGDLLQVQLLTDPARPREYSIGSLMSDGAVHLLVRLERHADGTQGRASACLTCEAAVGGTISARLRPHGNFRIGDNAARDLILIGNGTGLAGLRAHLKQRAEERARGVAARRHWLLFGERQAAHDAFHREELLGWQADGLLTHLDLVYSRDGHAERYVQDRLRARAERLRGWLQSGAALYVCGSLEGMAGGVTAVLQETLGEAGLAQLQQQGRYRRDVY